MRLMPPVENLEASVEFYCDAGLQPVWWPDDTEVVLAAGLSSPAALMLVNDPTESSAGCGGVFWLRHIDRYHQDHPGLDWLLAPADRALRDLHRRDRHAVRLLDCGQNRHARAVLAPRR